jgi:hypothetical protein
MFILAKTSQKDLFLITTSLTSFLSSFQRYKQSDTKVSWQETFAPFFVVTTR